MSKNKLFFLKIKNYALLAQLDRAFVYGTKGQGFESLATHQKSDIWISLFLFHFYYKLICLITILFFNFFSISFFITVFFFEIKLSIPKNSIFRFRICLANLFLIHLFQSCFFRCLFLFDLVPVCNTPLYNRLF